MYNIRNVLVWISFPNGTKYDFDKVVITKLDYIGCCRYVLLFVSYLVSTWYLIFHYGLFNITQSSPQTELLQSLPSVVTQLHYVALQSWNIRPGVEGKNQGAGLWG